MGVFYWYSESKSKSILSTSIKDQSKMEKSRLSVSIAHPKAIALLTEDFYWSEADEFSPFGNDDGNDVEVYVGKRS